MRKIVATVLYTALLLGANTALATDLDALREIRTGDMKKLNIHSEPKPAAQGRFQTYEGVEMGLEAYRGKYVLVNFWATWCAPCRAEMPSLDALQVQKGGARFEVVTIATGRNPPPAIKKFFEKAGVSHLPMHRDPQQLLAREMAVMGLPVSVLLDPEGREIGRLIGDADWQGEAAMALIEQLIGTES